MLCRSIFKFIIILFYLPCVYAVDSTNKNGTLTQVPESISIAYSKTAFPYHFQDENGEPAGMMIDFWRLFAKKQNIEVSFKAFSWKDTINNVQQGNIELHAGMSIQPERAKEFIFTPEAFPHNSYIYANINLNDIDSIAKLSPYTIGTVTASSDNESLLTFPENIKIREYPSREALYEAAINGEVLAFAELHKFNENFESLKELTDLYPVHRRINYFKSSFAGALNADKKYLLPFIEKGMSKISAQEKSAIESKWLKISPSEQQLNIAFSLNLPPYMAISPTGKAQGLYIDVWRLWSDINGIEVQFIPENMQRSLEMVKSNQADAHLAYPDTIPTNTGMLAAAHLYSLHSQIYVSFRLPNIDNIEQLNGRRVGMFSTAPYRIEFEKDNPLINVVYFNDHLEMITAAENKEIDAMISEVENMNIKLVRANLQSSFYLLAEPKFDSSMYVLVNPENKDLANKISQGFLKLPIQDLIEIESKWLTHKDEGFFKYKSSQISKTKNEVEWIKNNSSITIGLAKNWRPIEFLDDNGEVVGINKDIFDFIGKKTGLSINYRVFEHFKDALEAIEKNEIQAVGSVAQTDKRRDKFLFSQKYLDLPWVILHRNNQYKSFKNVDLNEKQFAVTKAYSLIEPFRKLYPNATLKFVDSSEQGLLATQQGLVDGYIDNLAVISQLAKRESLVSLSMTIIEGLDNHPSRIAVSKNNELLLQIINKSLSSMSEGELQAIYDKWFEISINTGFDKRLVTTVAAQIGAVIVIVIFVFFYWNRRLRIEIKKRKSLEGEMKYIATHDELTCVANRSLLKERIESALAIHQRQNIELAVLFIDLDGFKKVNDNHGHHIGDKLLQMVATRLSGCIRKSDTVARFGGDEFVLLLTSLHSKNEANYVADKVLKVIQQPFELDAVTANIGCSIGIAVYPYDGQSEAELLKVADMLMYKVKSQGKNSYLQR